ncbi:GtrA family protein [Pseudoduganella sp. DS3]|uniref:GtrA family protein n=1 Tax=Pseudoduganella guangdongensis TaxID=2692179 RepID=A0A6N9HIY6_9BURK|nr:GtrA family protein [Pseudoduganella guangdongensis]MYN03083.1 GtrA family protein [Pseudoduganella guangdongensis]
MSAARALWQRRWLRFLLVGGVNTAASYAVYALLLFLGLPYALANLGGLVFGIVFSFRTHSALVFRQAGGRPFPRYLLAWALLYGVNVLLIGGFMRLGLDAYWAGAAAIAPMALLSYLVQKQFVFGDPA